MAETNREVLERVYAAIERDDIEAFLEFVDPDVEFHSLVAEAEGGAYRGHEGVRQWWAMARDALGGLTFELGDFQDFGDRGIAQVTVTGNVGGTAISQTMYQAIRTRDEKAVWWRIFRTREEAIAAMEAQR